MNRLKRTQFWGVDENDERLLNQVLAGDKTATACPACEYLVPYGDYDDGGYEVGELVEVYDLKQRKRCMIRITEVYKTTFGGFPDKLWQGECNSNAEEFRQDHIYCWPEYDIDDDFEMIINHFELVEIFK